VTLYPSGGPACAIVKPADQQRASVTDGNGPNRDGFYPELRIGSVVLTAHRHLSTGVHKKGGSMPPSARPMLRGSIIAIFTVGKSGR